MPIQQNADMSSGHVPSSRNVTQLGPEALQLC